MNSHDTQIRGYQSGNDWNGNNVPYLRTAYDGSPLATVFNGYCLEEEGSTGKTVLVGVGGGFVGMALGLIIMYMIMKRSNK